jgi:hypothetical protein
MIYGLFGVYWVMPCSVWDMLACWMGGFGRGVGGVWKAVPLCIMWCIWREQNAWFFEGKEMSMAKLKYLFLKSFYDWTLTYSSASVVGLLDFLDSLLIKKKIFWIPWVFTSFVFFFLFPFGCASPGYTTRVFGWFLFLFFIFNEFFTYKRKS